MMAIRCNICILAYTVLATQARNLSEHMLYTESRYCQLISSISGAILLDNILSRPDFYCVQNIINLCTLTPSCHDHVCKTYSSFYKVANQNSNLTTIDSLHYE